MAAAQDTAVWACRMPKLASGEERAAILDQCTMTDRTAFFETSTCPITKEVEDRLEQISLVVTKEAYGNAFMEDGAYRCSRCQQPLYDATAKFAGPCMWPSFRAGVENDGTLHLRPVEAYNNYTCPVWEVYCGQCQLFLGHRFEDGKDHGDEHEDARFRHCVLSYSLQFVPR